MFSSTWQYTIWPGTVSFPMGTANRQPDEQSMQVYQLNKIVYPTGGYSEFIYESNKVDYFGQGVKLVGGLRIKQINTNDGKGLTTTKTYKYGISESGVGQLLIDGYNQSNFTQELGTYFKHCDAYYAGSAYDVRKITTTNLSDGSGILSALPMVYPEVTEYSGTEIKNTGKTIYKYYPFAQSAFYTGSVYGGALGNYLKYIGNWGKSGLYEKNTYKNNGSDYALLKKEKYFYQNFYKDTLKALCVLKYKSHDFNGREVGPPGGESTLSWLQKFGMPYSYADASYFIIAQKLSRKITYTYTNNGILTDSIQYNYSNINHLLPTQIISSANNDELTISSQKYVLDYNLTGTLENNVAKGIKNLQNLNVISPVIEQYVQRSKVDGKNLRTVSSSFNIYKPTSPYLDVNYTLETNQPITDYQPVTITSSSITMDNRFKARFNFDTYDLHGNILQQHKSGDINHSYLWGYNKQYPIAEAVNAKTNEIYFASFEEGRWDYNMQYDNAFAHAGKYSGRIIKTTAGESTSLSTTWLQPGLAAPKKFHYSGWIYSNGPSASIYLIMKRAGETAYHTYADQVSTTEINKWVYIKKDYTVPADVSTMALRVDNNGGGTVWFDDLRLHPSDAQMTTYTYTPLVGMTSQSDVNNRMTTYEYDGLGRLSLIRGNDGHILKKYQYAYRSGNPNSGIACNTSNCAGVDEKCVNGFCEKAKRINTSTVLIKTGENAGKWKCSYYYQWSDGLTSPPNALPADGSTPVRLNEFNIIPCDIIQ